MTVTAASSDTPGRQSVPHARKPALARHRSVRYLVGLAVYLGIALWLTGIPGHDIVHHMLAPEAPVQRVDAQTTMFFLKWWPWAILHGHNPFMVRQLTWPATYNAAWLTSVAAPALVGAPVTLLLGPIATWNLWLLLAPVAASMAMLTLLDTLEVPPVPAVTGGFVFGFCSLVVAEMMEGRLFLTLVFPLPLLAALLIRRLRGQIRPAWFVALSVLLAAFLLYTSTELFATATFAGILGCLLLLIWYRRAFVDAARKIARELIGVVVGLAVLGAPLFWYALADLGVAKTPLESSAVYSIDLFNYVVPTPPTLLGTSLAMRLGDFADNRPAEEGYLGILLLIVCILAIAQGLRRRRWAAPFAIWTVVLGICALGPQLHLDLHGVATSVPLPWKLASHIPALEDALPERLVLYVFLGAAAWAALWVSWASGRRQRLVRSLALVAAAVLLLPNPGWLPWQPPAIPPAASDGQLAAWVPPHTGLLVVADPTRQQVLWSEATNFRVSVSGPPWGYDPYKGEDYQAWPLTAFAHLSVPPPGAILQLEAFSAAHDDGAIAVPDGAPAWVRLLNPLGWRHRHLPGATVYRVPKAVLAQYRRATPAQLETDFYHTEVEALETAGACYVRRGGALSSLTPATAVERHCLNPAYLSSSPTSPWTADGGWLGPQGSQIGVGIATTGAVAAKVFAHTPLPQKWLVYDPTATPVTLAAMPHGPSGTYMAVGPFSP